MAENERTKLHLATHEKMHCNCEIVWLRIGRAAVH
jgi:hypothetical protein